jgi:hypothetical protein
VDEISKVISDYSGPQGYDLVIDKSSASAASGVSIVLYNSSKLIDITDDIINLAQSTPGPPARCDALPLPRDSPVSRHARPLTFPGARRRRTSLLVTVHTVRSLADHVGGTILGDGAENRRHRHQRSPFRAARPGFLPGQREVRTLAQASRAAAILVSPKDASRGSPSPGSWSNRPAAFGKIAAYSPRRRSGTSRASIPRGRRARCRHRRGRQHPGPRRHLPPVSASGRAPWWGPIASSASRPRLATTPGFIRWSPSASEA